MTELSEGEKIHLLGIAQDHQEQQTHSLIHNSAHTSQANDSTESSPSEWRDCCCSLFNGTMGGDVWMPALYHSSSRRRRMALWADA